MITKNVRTITIGPINNEIVPRPIHELGGVVGVERGVVEPVAALHGHGESAVKEHATLVPEGQGATRVDRRTVDLVCAEVDLSHGRLPAWAVRHAV